MSHDRVSLAGTMIAIGAMYLGLSLQGIRREYAKVETVCTPIYTPKAKPVESDDKKDDKKGK